LSRYHYAGGLGGECDAQEAAPIDVLLQWAYRDELPKRQTDCDWRTMFKA
jgi:hypothetical protein